LSTAWHLITSEHRPAAAQYQILKAEAQALTVAVKQVFPLKANPRWVLPGVLAAAVCTLFIARYCRTESLDFRAPMLALTFSFANQSESESPIDGKQSDTARQSYRSTERHSEPLNTATADPIADSANSSTSEMQSQAAESQSTTTKATQNGPTDTSQPGLLDRMKGALSAMMSKMKSSAGSDGANQNERTANSAMDKQGQAAPKEQESPESAAAKQQTEGQAAQAGAKTQSSDRGPGPGDGEDGRPESQSSNSQSGAGRQDGKKTLTEAEELKAMGKMAEIIGKRAAALTGDMEIEQPSGPQKLSSEYSGRHARHADPGAPIDHNEISAEDREYVREYMDAMHKQTDGRR
ncbi:MAG: hypothetical protein JO061_24180, partial [Acidobacteriaceae bacterium]|nr:hypothetical protein [Acidobacteriaceae bacterium]